MEATIALNSAKPAAPFHRGRRASFGGTNPPIETLSLFERIIATRFVRAYIGSVRERSPSIEN